MKVHIGITFLAFICVAAAADMPDKKDMLNAMINKINSWTGSVDDLKEEIKKGINSDSGSYTLAEVNQFIDQICAAWTLKIWKCDDYRTFVIDTKKAAGSIKSK